MTAVFWFTALVMLAISLALIVVGILRLIAARLYLRASRADSDYRAARLIALARAEVGHG